MSKVEVVGNHDQYARRVVCQEAIQNVRLVIYSFGDRNAREFIYSRLVKGLYRKVQYARLVLIFFENVKAVGLHFASYIG